MQESFIQRAVRILNRRDSIEAISAVAREKIGSEISIGFPIYNKDKKNIHFIVGTRNSTTALATAISHILEFDYEDADEVGDVVIFNGITPPQTVLEYVKDITSLTPENYDNIQVLLKKHYPEFCADSAVTHQDKRQRPDSISSTSSSSSSLFTQNAGHQNAKVSITEEMIVDYLKQSPQIWEGIRRSPEILDKACSRAKRAFNDDLPLNPKTVSPQK